MAIIVGNHTRRTLVIGLSQDDPEILAWNLPAGFVVDRLVLTYTSSVASPNFGVGRFSVRAGSFPADSQTQFNALSRELSGGIDSTTLVPFIRVPFGETVGVEIFLGFIIEFQTRFLCLQTLVEEADGTVSAGLLGTIPRRQDVPDFVRQ